MTTTDLVRADFALIPASPLFDAVIAASQAITDEFCYNENVIDAKNFPPHLSMHICAIPRDTLGAVTAALEAAAASGGLPAIVLAGIEPARGGYVMLAVERTPELMALHEAVLGIAAEARRGPEGDPYGSSYIRDAFAPHISLAKLGRDDQAGAAAIARTILASSVAVPPQALELVDIGERSERWDVLSSVPVAAPPGPGS